MIGSQASGLLKKLEALRVSLLNEIVQQERIELLSNYAYVEKQLQPRIVNSYPVFQFCYRGSMPVYEQGNKDYQFDVRNFYFASTLNMYDFKNIDFKFDQATIIIQHYFADSVIRDLDNRNRKYVIDAIRHSGLIADDHYKQLSIFEEGFYIEKNDYVNSPYLNVFLLETKNVPDFFSYKAELSQPENVQALLERHLNALSMQTGKESKTNPEFM